jgi:hypothetical protein
MDHEKETKPVKYRFDADLIELLNAWAFVSKKNKGALLQEAFRAYASMKENENTMMAVLTIQENMKPADKPAAKAK